MQFNTSWEQDPLLCNTGKVFSGGDGSAAHINLLEHYTSLSQSCFFLFHLTLVISECEGAKSRVFCQGTACPLLLSFLVYSLFPPVLLRFNRHVISYSLKVCSIMICYLSALQNDDNSKLTPSTSHSYRCFFL